MFLCFFILTVLCRKIGPVYRLQDEQSLFSPSLDDNGRNTRWNFLQEYLAVTYADTNTFTRLGHIVSPSSGAIISKTPLSSDEFRVDVNFMIDEAEHMRDGFAVWLTKEKDFKPGHCFGRETKFNGLLVIIYNKKENGTYVPYIGVACGNDLDYDTTQYGANIIASPVKLSPKIFSSKNTLRILSLDGELTVQMNFGNRNFTEVYKITNHGIGKGFTLAISSSNSEGKSDFMVSGVRTYNIEKKPVVSSGDSEKTEKKGTSKIVWGVFILAVLAIAAFVVPKQLRN